jgi:hypothetical protein
MRLTGEYENFAHLPGESIDALFQRFTVVVKNMKAKSWRTT